jgi:hypothetical protein
MISKPEWLLYAEKVRAQLSNMKDTKSGKRSERASLAAWKHAMNELSYEGSFNDWQYLMRRMPRR